MRLDNLPTGVFTAGPAPKGTEKPAPSEEDAGFVVPPARFLPGVGCSAVVFLPKRRPGCPFALPCRASRALDSAAPQVPKRPRYAPFAALFCGRRFFHGGRRRGTHNANIRRVEQRRRPLAPAGNAFRRISCRAFPQQSRCRASPPPSPSSLPGGGIVPGFPVRAGRVQKYTAFSPKNP